MTATTWEVFDDEPTLECRSESSVSQEGPVFFLRIIGTSDEYKLSKSELIDIYHLADSSHQRVGGMFLGMIETGLLTSINESRLTDGVADESK